MTRPYTTYQDGAQSAQRANMLPPPHQYGSPPPNHGAARGGAALDHNVSGHASYATSEPVIKDDPEPTVSGDALAVVEGGDENRIYRLVVVQQPQRARMCGFGDKDRRPITPPPCIKVVVLDRKTGEPVDCNDIDYSHYVLTVDLWNEQGTQEVNLVKHSANSPSTISSTSSASYRQTESLFYGGFPQPYDGAESLGRDAQFSQPGPPLYGHPQTHMPQYPPDAYGPTQYQYQQPYAIQNNGDFRPSLGSIPQMPMPSQAVYPARFAPFPTPAVAQPQQSHGMFTRNLIGNLAASASRLADPNEKIGIWFIMQDLSVRTEGFFRLRFNFVNLAPVDGQPPRSAASLSRCFSEPFQVYSAKKFPGVCDSTDYSRCFANQGVKIAIRGGDKFGKGNDDDDDFD